MLTDYFWYRFLRNRRGSRLHLPIVLLTLILVAGLIYAAVFVAAVIKGNYRTHAH